MLSVVRPFADGPDRQSDLFALSNDPEVARMQIMLVAHQGVQRTMTNGLPQDAIDGMDAIGRYFEEHIADDEAGKVSVRDFHIGGTVVNLQRPHASGGAAFDADAPIAACGRREEPRQDPNATGSSVPVRRWKIPTF